MLSVVRVRLVVCVIAVAALAGPSPAWSFPIGIVSFDTFIPGPDGINALSVNNLTGDFSLPPDFPVTAPLTFLDSTLSLTREGGTIDIFDLGDIGPGPFEDPRLLFPDLDAFVSATFSATLSTQNLLLADGSTLFASSAAFLLTLLPSTGTVLAPGDFAIIDVAADPQPPAIPEPGTLALFGTGLAVLRIVSRRRKHAV